jgi:hypothetical protein
MAAQITLCRFRVQQFREIRIFNTIIRDIRGKQYLICKVQHYCWLFKLMISHFLFQKYEIMTVDAPALLVWRMRSMNHRNIGLCRNW